VHHDDGPTGGEACLPCVSALWNGAASYAGTGPTAAVTWGVAVLSARGDEPDRDARPTPT